MEKVSKSDAEWREQLSDLAFKVTRKHGTERAGTHEDFPKDPGHVCLHLLRRGAVRSGREIRKRHRLARLFRTA